MVHILDEYKADCASGTRSTFEAELRAVKEEQKRLKKKYAEIENLSSELAKTNHYFYNSSFYGFLFPVFLLLCV